MSPPGRPQFDPEDDLTDAADIDINAALADLHRQRLESPIVRPSKAADVAELIDASYPHGGERLERLVEQIRKANDAYPRRNTHPGFFGWIPPSGLPSDALAHAMVSVLNGNVVGYWAAPMATTVEQTVVRWLADLAGFPDAAQGALLSGGSIANLCGIASACARRFGPDYRRRGIAAYSEPSAPVILCSEAAHFSIRRAVVLLGIGTDNIIGIDTDNQFCMQVDALEAAIEAHDNIICVVASAGTTNTGAIDPLDDIAEVCERHGIWLHVDAAYGAGGLMSGELQPRYRGIERADSVVMDLHKWFFQALSCSLILYRDAQWSRQLFSETSDYLRKGLDDTPEEFAFFNLSPELSRRFRALPVFLSMRCYGLDRLGRLALYNVRLAEYLADRVRDDDALELVNPPQLSIMTFRYRPAGAGDELADRLTSAIRERIELEGDYLMSPTTVHGRPVFRVCIINHATRVEHIDGMLDSVLRIGAELSDENPPA